MTQEQTTDLKTWLEQQQEEALPESLKNKLIDDFIFELANNKQTCDTFNSISSIKYHGDGFYADSSYGNFNELIEMEQENALIKLLSRIDGKAVIPFLDVDVEIDLPGAFLSYNTFKNSMHRASNSFDPDSIFYEKITEDTYSSDFAAYFEELVNKHVPKKLDHLLYREFTEALRIGKTFESALEIITKIYLVQQYV